MKKILLTGVAGFIGQKTAELLLREGYWVIGIDKRSFQRTDMKKTWADISKAKKLLDWSPEVDFEEGLDRTIKWYQENKSWLANIEV